jgi:hypothetical protein
MIAGPRKYAKIVERITIPELPPDNSAEVVLLFRSDEVVLQIQGQVWKWPQRKWEVGTDPEG